MGRTQAFIEVARDYATRVLEGKIVAGSLAKLACARFVADEKRSADGWTYRLDEERAAAACKFIGLLPHIKGKWGTQTIDLEPWQIFILVNLFGWIGEDGFRRFRTAYIEVARKNAKSTLSSGIALYLLAGDGEPGAEVYSAATTRDQAKIVWEASKEMVKRTPGLQSAFGVTPMAHSILVPETASTFKALASQEDKLDGLNPHGAIVDEFHAHGDRGVWDVLDSARGSRNQSLLLAITTAGFNRQAVCYKEREDVVKVLNGQLQSDRYFGLIYTIDDGDDWADPAVWLKSNPNYGVSVLSADMEDQAARALSNAQAQTNFLTKRLNVWVNADSAWMNMRAWDQAAEDIRIEDFADWDCYIGLDLAAKRDITAKVYLFVKDNQFRVFGRYYLPEAVAENRDHPNASAYDGWARSGHLVLTDGNEVDYSLVEEEIVQDPLKYRVQKIAYDPWQALQLIQKLKDQGAPVVDIRPGVAQFSEPMKELEAMVISGRLKHDGNPLLTWMVSNVVCHRDAKDNIYPRKSRDENKIDGVVALIMALNMALRGQSTSVYETREPLII